MTELDKTCVFEQKQLKKKYPSPAPLGKTIRIIPRFRGAVYHQLFIIICIIITISSSISCRIKL